MRSEAEIREKMAFLQEVAGDWKCEVAAGQAELQRFPEGYLQYAGSIVRETHTQITLLEWVLDKTWPILEPERYLAVVIEDKYSAGEWIPLGFRVMQEVLKRRYSLKSIVVKNFEETRAKRNQKKFVAV